MIEFKQRDHTSWVFFSFVAWMKWSLNSWQDDDFLSCRTVTRKYNYFSVVKRKLLNLQQSSLTLWTIIQLVQELFRNSGFQPVSLCIFKLRWDEVTCDLCPAGFSCKWVHLLSSSPVTRLSKWHQDHCPRFVPLLNTSSSTHPAAPGGLRLPLHTAPHNPEMEVTS